MVKPMQNQKNTGSMRIGLFDSGVGGLSILRRLQESCISSGLNGQFVYLADSGRCPYGERTKQEIESFVNQISNWFNRIDLDLLVMACNTSAALAGEIARKESKSAVYDLIQPAASYAAANFKRIAVIATSATCRSQAFSREIKVANAELDVLEIACPDLVPLVEKGILTGPVVRKTIEKYAEQLVSFEADSLIFGCTHFPFLEAAFKELLPADICYIDPAEQLNRLLFGRLPLYLQNEALTEETLSESMIKVLDAKPTSAFTNNRYFCTGNLQSFSSTAELCLGLESGQLLSSVQRLSIEELQNLLTPVPAPGSAASAAETLRSS